MISARPHSGRPCPRPPLACRGGWDQRPSAGSCGPGPPHGLGFCSCGSPGAGNGADTAVPLTGPVAAPHSHGRPDLTQGSKTQTPGPGGGSSSPKSKRVDVGTPTEAGKTRVGPGALKLRRHEGPRASAPGPARASGAAGGLGPHEARATAKAKTPHPALSRRPVRLCGPRKHRRPGGKTAADESGRPGPEPAALAATEHQTAGGPTRDGSRE